MRLLLLGVIIAAASATTYAQTLKVVVKNVKSAQGNVLIALYNAEDAFMKKPFKTLAATASQGAMELIFPNLPAGKYAFSIIHDENGNNELDTKFMGIPKEGFGFSNNAMGMFGPPDFKKASFNFTAEATAAIELKYL